MEFTTEDSTVHAEVMAMLESYESMKKTLRDLEESSTKSLETHKDFNDKCNELREWITNMQDKLALVFTMTADKQTLQINYNTLESCSSVKDNGRQMYEELCELTKIALESGYESSVMQKEQEQLKVELDDCLENIDDHMQQIEKSLKTWEEFEENCGDFMKWIKQCETDVKSNSEYTTTLEEKEHALQCNKDHMSEISKREASLDTLSDSVQMLLQRTDNSEIANQITHLNQLYSALSTLVKGTHKKLCQYLDDHKQYKDNSHKCMSWIESFSERLEPCVYTSGERQVLEEKLHQLQVSTESL